ncbi:MAG: uroporphyrinogen decarboxylase family protein [Candidatus Limiplasma sp.]|nr:uroporphyrinogen decarboxylase family protein [Candidatus Limiplasma sp.]
MNVAKLLWDAAGKSPKGALPVLSFPAVQKMGITVRELVESSEQQARAMKIVADEVPALASVSLMDLSVEAQAFGATVRFSDHEVPTIIGQLVSDADAAEALAVPRVGDGRTGVCVEAIRLAKQQITDRPVLAGVIGPYSLAGRLCDVTEIMFLCYDEPDMVHTVLRKATDFLIQYCLAFREAGADGVVMAEPLAGLLSPDLSEEFSIPYVRQIIEAVQTDSFAVIYHNCGNAVIQMLDQIFSLNAAAYHFGNAVSMRAVLDAAPKSALCMGNIDPAAQFAEGTPESIAQATRELMQVCGGEPNFLPSSGCDIPPHASWENIHAFFHALQG